MYLGIKSANSFSQCVASSLGFTTTQFPAAIAPRIGETIRKMGKLKGPMIKHTPNGSYTNSAVAGAIVTGTRPVTGLFQESRFFKNSSISAIHGSTSSPIVVYIKSYEYNNK